VSRRFKWGRREPPPPPIRLIRPEPEPVKAVYRCSECKDLTTAIVETTEYTFIPASRVGFDPGESVAVTHAARLCVECYQSAIKRGMGYVTVHHVNF
jgi:hypothetical protein